jgi:putative hemolysin
LEDLGPYQTSIPIALVSQPLGFNIDLITGIVAILLLLFLLTLVSGGEVLFFSVLPADGEKKHSKKSGIQNSIIRLIKYPEILQTTISITKSLVNVLIVVFSTSLATQFLNHGNSLLAEVIITLIIISLLVLFYSETIPGNLAARYKPAFILLSVPVLQTFFILFWPISYILKIFSRKLNRILLQNSESYSVNELSDALELNEVTLSEEKSILKGIVKFTNIYVSEIMKSRIDIVGADITTSYTDLLRIINESGYSRIPVYNETFDDIKGILYIKDLLLHLEKQSGFKWQSLIRPPYFVPESKKINDLLKEFQKKHIHMAVVVDEYGGTSGIVTLEDILEEIVGEISDESDAEELAYKMIDANTFLFEGKVLLNDFYKIANVSDDIFEKVKGEADTLAGLILEIKGEIPKPKDKICYGSFKFEIREVDKRRIKMIHVSIIRNNN